MVVVDSSAWIEYLLDGPDSDLIEPFFQDPDKLILPAICVAEIERYLRAFGDPPALETARQAMSVAKTISLDQNLAREAAEVGMRLRLPMADSIIYATARAFDADLLTLDAHFEGLPGVRYIKPRRKKR